MVHQRTTRRSPRTPKDSGTASPVNDENDSSLHNRPQVSIGGLQGLGLRRTPKRRKTSPTDDDTSPPVCTRKRARQQCGEIVTPSRKRDKSHDTTGKCEAIARNIASKNMDAVCTSASKRQEIQKDVQIDQQSAAMADAGGLSDGVGQGETVDILTAMKKSLHSSAIPDALIGRVKEYKQVQDFWHNCYAKKLSGALYISGSPGTGKTASVDMVEKEIHAWEKKQKRSKRMLVVKINCMSVITPRAIYTEIYTQITGGCVPMAGASEAVEGILCPEPADRAKLPMITVIVDEVDALSRNDKNVLYHLFELPQLKHSRLILIGIANTLDFTDRLLPRLRAKSCEPMSIVFNPYTRAEIVAILQGRISSVSERYEDKTVVADKMAVEFCARKISATSGDIRQAMEVLRKAVVVAAEQSKYKISCQSEGTQPTTASTPAIKVSVGHVLAVFKGNSNSAIVQKVKGLPLHHLIILLVYTTYVIENTAHNAKRMTVGKLHDTYSIWCREKIGAPVSNTDVTDILEMLQGMGILDVASRPANIRQREITLRADIKDIRKGVAHDEILKGHILAYDLKTGRTPQPTT